MPHLDGVNLHPAHAFLQLSGGKIHKHTGHSNGFRQQLHRLVGSIPGILEGHSKFPGPLCKQFLRVDFIQLFLRKTDAILSAVLFQHQLLIILLVHRFPHNIRNVNGILCLRSKGINRGCRLAGCQMEHEISCIGLAVPILCPLKAPASQRNTIRCFQNIRTRSLEILPAEIAENHIAFPVVLLRFQGIAFRRRYPKKHIAGHLILNGG